MSQGRAPQPLVVVLAALAACAAGLASGAGNIDPAGDGHHFAWGENVGWINTKPAGEGGPGVEVGDTALMGWMWGENIGWINLSCANEGSCAVSPYGVTNDGFGRLTGFAWGENVGWINFGPTTCAEDPTCGVRIDPATGYFEGRAWGETIGWVTFASAGPVDWTTRTSWCQATPGPPGPAGLLTLQEAGGDLSLTWSPLDGASWYDVVGGSLSALSASAGDFRAATLQCVAARTVAPSVTVPAPGVKPGDGAWFLVRGANCRGRGTYDTGSPSQVGDRDAGIAASRNDCS